MIILPNQVTEAINLLENAGFEAYIVGSCVRELLIGNTPMDFDIVTSAGINDIQYIFREYRISDEFLPQGAVLVTVVGMIIEISPFRREVVGNRVMYAPDLDTDLSRRGFTMNAMAYSPKTGLIDPYGGKSCLTGEEFRIVAIGENITRTSKEDGKAVTETYYDMSRSFTTDPSRILKAIRYCAEREFVIDDSTRAAMRQNVSCFDYAEQHKMADELSRIVMGKYAAKVLENYSDILKYAIPEIEPCIGFEQHTPFHDFDVWTHTAKAVGYSVPELPLRMAMFFHDIGKPDCCSIDAKGEGHFKGHGERSRLLAERIMRRMGFAKPLMEEVSWLIYHHTCEIPDDRKKLKGLIRELGTTDLRNLILCKIADNRAKKEVSETFGVSRLRKSLEALDEIIETGECWDISQLAVTKKDLIDRRLVTSEAEAEELHKVLFDIVLDKPSFNNRLMLLDMAEKSRQKIIEIQEQRAAEAAQRAEIAAIPHNRRNEPVFTRKKTNK